MEMRKLQLYVTERQYRLLKQRAGRRRGSIASVVRELIDRSVLPTEVETDPFFRHVAAPKEGSGQPYEAQEAKRDLYRQPT
jgi:hypothetical protein